MVDALERHPGVRVGLHYTGPLLDWLGFAHPGFLARVRGLVASGQVEVLGGGLYEPILVALPVRDRVGQLVGMADEVERLFAGRPHGAWLAERVWEPSLPADLADSGYAWTVLDDNHLRSAAVREQDMWGTYTTDDQGRRVTIFGTEQGLRYRIPFHPVEEVIGYLREHATEDGARLGIMGDDGEKFGSWPGTYEHCWGEERWVERCFEAIEANAGWLTTVTPSDWMASHPPLGRIYVPAASYVEMTEWALPAHEANAFHQLLERARHDGRPEARFLQGAMWRNFQTRYREVNDLHKQMLRVSTKVQAMPAGEERQRALGHLYRGQSNDCYWHGLFGGIYIVHMRMATLGHLIAAEDLADSLRSPRGARLHDVDLDGLDEAVLAEPGQVVAVDLAEGAGIGSWDLRASRLALASVMRRRPEAYHEKLLEHELAAHAAQGAAAGDADEGLEGAERGPKTIHDLVRVKEAGLSERLHYDWHERRSALVHLIEAVDGRDTSTLGPAAFAQVHYRELGDFVDRPFSPVSLRAGELVARRTGHVWLDGRRHPLSVTKRLLLAGDRTRPSLELSVEVRNEGASEVRSELALEWGFDLMGGGGNPAAFYESPAGGGRRPHDGSGDVWECQRLAFGNDDEGIRVDAFASPACRVTWFPVETVSNSEAGFERSYQGSSLLFRWPLVLAPGETAGRSVRFDITQRRDRLAEERGAAEGSSPSASV